nr:MAG TPA: hypothetical protein [Bacteriophage sp.]
MHCTPRRRVKACLYVSSIWADFKNSTYQGGNYHGIQTDRC